MHPTLTTPRTPIAAQVNGRATRQRPRRLSGQALVAPLTWDPIRIALGGLMLVTISRVHQQLTFLQVFRPGLLLTAAALGFAVAFPRAINTKELLSTWPVRRVFALLAIAIIGAPLGLGFRPSLTFLNEVYVPNIVFFALLVVAVRNTGDLRFLIGSFVASAAILVYMSLFVFDSRSFYGFERMASTIMYDANDLGAVFAAAIPLGLLIAQTSTGWVRAIGYVTAAGGPATIALAGSRGGFLALIATGLGLLAMMPRATWGRRIGIVLTAVIVMAMVAPEGYLSKMNSIVNPTEDYNLTSQTGRVEIWKRGLANLAPRPLTGVGINNFARAQWVNQAYTDDGRPIRAMSSHNTFLQIGVDLGVPAFLIFVSIILGAIFTLLRMRSRMPLSWLTDSPERRFLYVSCSYLPVAFFGWASGAFFVSHAYLMPFYCLVAYLAGVLMLYRHEMRGSRGQAPLGRARNRFPQGGSSSPASSLTPLEHHR